MSYYQRHIFFCLNQREGGENCCAQHNAQAGSSTARRAKAEGLTRAGVRVNRAGCLDRCAGGLVAVVYPRASGTPSSTPDIDEIVDAHLEVGRVERPFCRRDRAREPDERGHPARGHPASRGRFRRRARGASTRRRRRSGAVASR